MGHISHSGAPDATGAAISRPTLPPAAPSPPPGWTPAPYTVKQAFVTGAVNIQGRGGACWGDQHPQSSPGQVTHLLGSPTQRGPGPWTRSGAQRDRPRVGLAGSRQHPGPGGWRGCCGPRAGLSRQEPLSRSWRPRSSLPLPGVCILAPRSRQEEAALWTCCDVISTLRLLPRAAAPSCGAQGATV